MEGGGGFGKVVTPEGGDMVFEVGAVGPVVELDDTLVAGGVLSMSIALALFVPLTSGSVPKLLPACLVSSSPSSPVSSLMIKGFVLFPVPVG